MNELNKTKNKGWFKVGNIFFDAYSKYIGYIPAIVYLFIKRYEHLNTRYSWPSEDFIAENLDMSSRTVLRAIKILKVHNFIVIEKVKNGGKWSYNKYYLTHSKDWLTEPCDLKSYGPSDKKDKNQVTQGHSKNTNNKKTEVPRSIKEYKPNCLKNNDP